MPNNAVETSLEFASLADSFFSNRTIAASLTSILVLTIACRIVHCIWPMHLTSVLVAFITETENLYYDAIEAGELTGDVDTEEKLLNLQKKVSEIREDSLRNSLSAWKTLGDFFKGRSITLLQCADEIQKFQTHIETSPTNVERFLYDQQLDLIIFNSETSNGHGHRLDCVIPCSGRQCVAGVEGAGAFIKDF
ncbi:hypothetical protein C8J57DRAFT_1238658 [Mycena rebaudengoi]|nr:hypothetical protein C8J57DRAFT_1238658 [Mycena rebaudengoi]